MTERLRKILKGGNLTPVTADEAAVKIAVDNAGGGDTYETVAEIALGTMEHGTGQGLPETWWYDEVDTTPFAMMEDETYYLNDGDHPSDGVVIIPNTATMVLFNCKVADNTIVQIAEGKPSYVFIDDGNNYTGVCCNNNISGNTVRILKKVSGGGSELPAVTSEDNGKVLGVVDGAWGKMTPFVVEFTTTESGGVTSVSTTTTIAEILAAKSAGKTVIGIADIGAYTQEFSLTAFGPGLNNEGLVGFGAVLPDSGDQKASMFAVQGDVVVDGGTKTDRWQLFIG